MVPGYSLQGGAGGAAGPSTARSGDGIFDSSGWSVIFGNGNELAATRADTGNLGQYVPWVLAAVGLLIVVRMVKK